MHNLGLMGISFTDINGAISDYIFCMFQLMFAMIMVFLISRGMAECVKCKDYRVGGTGLLAGNLKQVGIQLIGTAASTAYSFIMIYGIMTVIDKTIGFRITDEDEEIRLDANQHGKTGYNL